MGLESSANCVSRRFRKRSSKRVVLLNGFVVPIWRLTLLESLVLQCNRFFQPLNEGVLLQRIPFPRSEAPPETLASSALRAVVLSDNEVIRAFSFMSRSSSSVRFKRARTSSLC